MRVRVVVERAIRACERSRAERGEQQVRDVREAVGRAIRVRASAVPSVGSLAMAPAAERGWRHGRRSKRAPVVRSSVRRLVCGSSETRERCGREHGAVRAPRGARWRRRPSTAGDDVFSFCHAARSLGLVRDRCGVSGPLACVRFRLRIKWRLP